MPSNAILEKKKQQVEALSEKMKNSCAGVLVDYKGISVEEDTKMRRELREAGIEYTVVKNTLLGMAAEKAGISGLEGYLNGTTSIALSEGDYVAAARIINKAAIEGKKISIKAGFIDGAVIDETGVKELADLPPREVLVAKALGGLNAPITGLVYVLNANLAGLARVLNAIAEKQQ